MNEYRNLHLWFLIPFAIGILGFMRTYWFQFAEVPWRQHVHGLSATLWMLALVLQPFLITRLKAQAHRVYGMIALFLAGGVVFSALAAIPHNLLAVDRPDSYRYGLSLIDLILLAGFSAAVIMAVVQAKSMHDHARWIISTVFWAILPGLSRIVGFFLVVGLNMPFSLPQGLAVTGIVSCLVLFYLMYRDRRAHPAYVAAIFGSLSFLLSEQFAAMQWWRDLADAILHV